MVLLSSRVITIGCFMSTAFAANGSINEGISFFVDDKMEPFLKMEAS